MLVDPIKPKSKPPGTKRLKLKCGHNSFKFCFQIQLAPLHQGAQGYCGGRQERAGSAAGGAQGRAVHVDPIKPMLKLPGTRPLKLISDIPLSTFGFIFNLHHYIKGRERREAAARAAAAGALGTAADAGDQGKPRVRESQGGPPSWVALQSAAAAVLAAGVSGGRPPPAVVMSVGSHKLTAHFRIS